MTSGIYAEAKGGRTSTRRRPKEESTTRKTILRQDTLKTGLLCIRSLSARTPNWATTAPWEETADISMTMRMATNTWSSTSRTSTNSLRGSTKKSKYPSSPTSASPYAKITNAMTSPATRGTCTNTASSPTTKKRSNFTKERFTKLKSE